MSSSSSSSASSSSSSSSSSSDSDSSQSENDERVSNTSVKDVARGLAEHEDDKSDEAYSDSFEDDEDGKDDDDDDDDDDDSDASSHHSEKKEEEPTYPQEEGTYPQEEEKVDKWRELDSDEENEKPKPQEKASHDSSSSSSDEDVPKAHTPVPAASATEEEAPLPRAVSRASNSSSGSSSSYHALGSERGTTPSRTPARRTSDHDGEGSNVKSSPPRHPLSGARPAFLDGSDLDGNEDEHDDGDVGIHGGAGVRSDASEAHTSVSRGGDAAVRPATASDATPSSRTDGGAKGEKAAQTPEARHRSTSVPDDRTELAAVWKENNDLRSNVEAAKAQLKQQKKQREKEARAAQNRKRNESAASNRGAYDGVSDHGAMDDMYDELVHEKRENRHLRREKERLEGLLIHFKKLQQRKQFIEKAKAEIAQLEQENKTMQNEIRTNARSLVSVSGKRSISRPQASGSVATTPTKSPTTTAGRGGNTSSRSPAGRGANGTRGGRGRGKSSTRANAQKRGVTGRSQPRSVARHTMDVSSQEEEERRKLIKDMETQLILAKKSCDRAQEEHATATRRKVELAMRVDQLQNEMAERLAHDSDRKMPYQKASQLTSLQEEAQSKDQEIAKLRKQLRRLKTASTTGRSQSMENNAAPDDVNTASETKYLTKRIKDMKREVERLRQRNANAPESARAAPQATATAVATAVAPKPQKSTPTPAEKATPKKPAETPKKPVAAEPVAQPPQVHPHETEQEHDRESAIAHSSPEPEKKSDESLWLGESEAEPVQKQGKPQSMSASLSQNTPARVHESEPTSAKGGAKNGGGDGMDWLEVDEKEKATHNHDNLQHNETVESAATNNNNNNNSPSRPRNSHEGSDGDGPLDIPVDESDDEKPPAAAPKQSEEAKNDGGLDWLGEDVPAAHPQVYKTEGSLTMTQKQSLEGEDDSIHGTHPQDGGHVAAKQPDPDPYRELSLSGEQGAEHVGDANHEKDASHATTSSSSEEGDAEAHEVEEEEEDDADDEEEEVDDDEDEEDDEDDEAELSKGDVPPEPAKADEGVPSWLDFDD